MSSSEAPASVGGTPTTLPDVPILSVFLALFIGLAAANMTLYLRNKKKGHFFVFNAMLFGFCMSRIMACTFRIAWSGRPDNDDLELVSLIFYNAGILLVYVINNILVWRKLRSRLPALGWHAVARILYKIQLWLCLPIIIMLIIAISIYVKIQTEYLSVLKEKMGRFAQTYFFVIAAQPLILLMVVNCWPAKGDRDEFGEGSWVVKSVILATTTLLATIEAAFRLGYTWQPSRSASNPAWYDSKAAFYCFSFMIDTLIVLVFLVARIDKRFWIPNKANGPGSYSAERASLKDGEEMREFGSQTTIV